MEHLSRHMQTIKEFTEEFQSRHPMVDRFRPSFTLTDGDEIATLVSRQISYYYTTKVFVKRQPHTDELDLDGYGNAAVLQFLAKHTTIPVPEFLDLWEENGLVYLKTALVENAVELRNVDESLLSTAIMSVTSQLESDILPQLRRLRRNFMGSPNPELPVIPPHRFWRAKEKRVWPSMTKDTNLLVGPNTFKIVSILDWETAGFFPQEWELPLWTVNGPQEKYRMSREAHGREIACFDVSDTTMLAGLRALFEIPV
ncbi:hypothetical protein E4U32_003305 [Claviceps aff. humidiphila group G2b]|nr:hypothetical protein E4U32_003305 [Claviceps aff. humidiphila group G2b]